MKKNAFSENAPEKAVLMPVLLQQLEHRRIDKRNVITRPRSDRHDSEKKSYLSSGVKPFKLNDISNKAEIRNSSRTMLHTTLASDRFLDNLEKNRGSKTPQRRMLSKTVKNRPRNKLYRRNHKKYKKLRNKYRLKSSRNSGKQSVKIGKVNLRTQNKGSKHKLKHASRKHDSSTNLKWMDAESNYLSQGNLPRVRSPLRGYHLVPYARIYPIYRPSLMDYPRMHRDRIYYREPNYGDSYYGDYETERKDVIPKPEIASLAVRGAKKDILYSEKNKRTAYSPIVSAVQNLDRSEANLFDSLLSTSHETNRLTEDIGSELSNFVASPGELEVYSPTDTPGELYFEKDRQDENYYSPQVTTNRPTESDASDITDNEAKLLAIVEKVIAKQKKKKKKEESKPLKSEAKASDIKDSGSFDIGDTSEVFNTESGEKEDEGSSKLNDFLSKQPKFEKKLKSSKQGAKSQKNPIGKSTKGYASKLDGNHGSKVFQNVQGQREKATTKVTGKKPKAGFLLSKSGQHVIVENVDPKNDKLLMESLTQLGDKARQRVRNSSGKKTAKAKKERPKNGKASAKSFASRIDEKHRFPHVIKEVTGESRQGGLPERENNDFNEAIDKHNGFETMPLSIHESHTSRYKIDGGDIPVVSEVSLDDMFLNKGKSQQALTGMKKDDSQPEEKPQSEKEKSDDKEATTESASKEKASSAEEEQKEETKGPAKETEGPTEETKSSAEEISSSKETNASKEEASDTQKPAESDGKVAAKTNSK